MCHHYPLIDHMAQRQLAEKLAEKIIGLHVVFSLYLPFKTVHLVQLLRLVVTPGHKKVLRDAHLPSEQSQHHFHREAAPINEVPIEQIGV